MRYPNYVILAEVTCGSLIPVAYANVERDARTIAEALTFNHGEPHRYALRDGGHGYTIINPNEMLESIGIYDHA